MQVTLLRLNTGIGSSLQRATALQRESSLLAAQVAGLSSAQRVQAEASALGMVYPPPDDVRYLHTSAGDAARAARSFVAPASSTTDPAGSTSSADSVSSASSTTGALSTTGSASSPGSLAAAGSSAAAPSSNAGSGASTPTGP